MGYGTCHTLCKLSTANPRTDAPRELYWPYPSPPRPLLDGRALLLLHQTTFQKGQAVLPLPGPPPGDIPLTFSRPAVYSCRNAARTLAGMPVALVRARQPDHHDAAAVFGPMATWKAEIRAGNFGCQTGAIKLGQPRPFPLLELPKGKNHHEAFSPAEPECGSPLWGAVSFWQNEAIIDSRTPVACHSLPTLNLRDVRAKGERGDPLAQVAQYLLGVPPTILGFAASLPDVPGK
ncbi:hypothetical protein VTN02DRAFT_401 [Thermoascus thermophilus]